MNHRKKTTAILLMAIIICTSFSSMKVSAETVKTSEYITANEFIELLIKKINIIPVDKTEEEPYVKAALTSGILKEDEIKDLNGYITRAECAVLLNRADLALHKDKLDKDNVSLIMKKRISDINKVPKKQREAVARVYALGIIRGSKLGWNIQQRAFHGTDYLTKKDAKVYIKKTVYPEFRAKMSPDGQLIRTTNLPKNAKKFPYILESFPNKFYDKPFFYQLYSYTSSPLKEGVDYVFPKNMEKTIYKTWLHEFNMREQMNYYLYDWTDYVEKNVKTIFNVNYKTIGKKWIKQLGECTDIEGYDAYLQNYIKKLKKNKVTVKLRKCVVEPSSFYYSSGYYMRAYVEFKVIALKDTKDLCDYFMCEGGIIDGFKLNKWMKGYIDIRLGSSDDSMDGSAMRAYRTWLRMER